MFFQWITIIIIIIYLGKIRLLLGKKKRVELKWKRDQKCKTEEEENGEDEVEKMEENEEDNGYLESIISDVRSSSPKGIRHHVI